MSKRREEIHDVIIIGDDVGAATAALFTAESGTRVLLIETPRSEFSEPKLDWIGPRGVEFCRRAGVSAKKIGATEFKECRLHSWDLRRNSLIKEKEYAGWIVPRAALFTELAEMAAKKGAQRDARTIPLSIMLADARVIIRCKTGAEIVGRILLIAGAADNPVVPLTNLIPAGHTREVAESLFVEYESPDRTNSLDIVIGATRAGRIATIIRCEGRVCMRLITRGGEEPIEKQFAELRSQALECGLLPAGASDQVVYGRSPGGAALDMDTHAGKRTLLFGAAGGFVSAFSHEELYPAMHSGQLAAETAVAALKAELTQDRLGEYGATWRSVLADYLRMPNTDLSLLVPLVFNNEQMAKRVARAFLLGQPF